MKKTEVEVWNHLLRTIASVKLPDDVTASPSKKCFWADVFHT